MLASCWVLFCFCFLSPRYGRKIPDIERLARRGWRFCDWVEQVLPTVISWHIGQNTYQHQKHLFNLTLEAQAAYSLSKVSAHFPLCPPCRRCYFYREETQASSMPTISGHFSLVGRDSLLEVPMSRNLMISLAL